MQQSATQAALTPSEPSGAPSSTRVLSNSVPDGLVGGRGSIADQAGAHGEADDAGHGAGEDVEDEAGERPVGEDVEEAGGKEAADEAGHGAGMAGDGLAGEARPGEEAGADDDANAVQAALDLAGLGADDFDDMLLQHALPDEEEVCKTRGMDAQAVGVPKRAHTRSRASVPKGRDSVKKKPKATAKLSTLQKSVGKTPSANRGRPARGQFVQRVVRRNQIPPA